MILRILALLLVSATGLVAAPLTFSSGPARVSLLELFSSEGCSSCPPAEAWLGNLRHDPGLWRDFVPVSFHVNYWDRLGWTDRLASREFTDRQYAYAKAWRAGTVYTPGFVLNGCEWRGHPDRVPPAPGLAGTLTVTVAAGACLVEFIPVSATTEDYEVNAAMLGGGIVSKVNAGENSGETLIHEFVALALERHALADGRTRFTLPASTPAGVKRRALAVWVTRVGSTEPLQATGGWLD